ncbi:acyl carrier protein [Microlunatus panaciterrae]|uniref:Acyl carrier protein n=1 Tax=Microlunatus panaciterrae TaxID=400768 RepID=A0ABS2RHL9_9ACTN|nr:acyl carrier protein [Microlunatus panaciterrae]MBM7798504.1 acyl carrier protein [Microlunatus panaciterrae]
MTVTTESLEGVKAVLAETLGIEDRIGTVDESTPLFGSMPELDSLALLDLVSGLEDRFGIVVDDAEFTGDIFETVGSLTAFVDTKVDSES